MRTRLLVAGSGAALALYGVLLLMVRQDAGQWLEIGLWLGAGVVAHDVVLSALVVATSLVGSRLLPSPWRAPAAVALDVGGTVTVVAVPVLIRAGARADNTTLLERP